MWVWPMEIVHSISLFVAEADLQVDALCIIQDVKLKQPDVNVSSFKC